ncbi:hypothetical protein B4113_1636 [Geobacillus sp. B4113_201601]|nr:hypothetical protein B4113_1636 [Geobacillus sp. B4113_201601]
MKKISSFFTALQANWSKFFIVVRFDFSYFFILHEPENLVKKSSL